MRTPPYSGSRGPPFGFCGHGGVRGEARRGEAEGGAAAAGGGRGPCGPLWRAAAALRGARSVRVSVRLSFRLSGRGCGSGDEIPRLRPGLRRPLRGRDGGRAVPERRVPGGGGPHVAVADAALRPAALRAGAAQPGLHPPRREPRPAAGAAAAPPAARAPRQVGEGPPRLLLGGRRGAPGGGGEAEGGGACELPRGRRRRPCPGAGGRGAVVLQSPYGACFGAAFRPSGFFFFFFSVLSARSFCPGGCEISRAMAGFARCRFIPRPHTPRLLPREEGRLAQSPL